MKAIRWILGIAAALGYLSAAALCFEMVWGWWMPLVLAVVLAMITGIIGWKPFRRITARDSCALNYGVYVVVVTGLLFSMVMVCNRMVAADAKPETVRAQVTGVWAEQRQRTRRVRKGVYVANGEKYSVYYCNVTFENGREKKMPLTVSQYLKLKRRRASGHSMTVCLRRGFIGGPIMQSGTIRYDVRTQILRGG